MKTRPLLLPLVLALLPVSSNATLASTTRALEELQAQAERGIIGSSAEGLRSRSAKGFTGEGSYAVAVPVNAAGAPQDLAAGKDLAAAPSQNLVGGKPQENLSRAKAKRGAPWGKTMSQESDGPTEMEKLIKGAIKVSLGVGAGLAIAGIWVPPLLFFGGFLLGVGATLYVITKLFGGQ